MISTVQVDAGDIIAGFALVLAIYSTWITSRFNKRQTAFEETAQQLNQLQIAREAGEVQAAKRADISASFYKVGKSDYRLKVFNRGPASARNLRFEVMDGGDLFVSSDVARQFPVPIIERHGAVELIAAVHLGSPSRAHIKLIWDDDFAEHNTKELHPGW